MRLTPMMLARQAVHFISRNAEAINRSLERLGTGQRLHRPSDDPPGVGLALRLQSDIAATEGDRQRIEQVLPYLQAADTAIQQALSLLQRARELFLQASNDTLTAEQRQAIANELSELRKELVQVANVQVGDRFLLAGSAILTKPFVVDNNGDVVYHGDSDQLSLVLSNGERLPVTLDGRRVFQSAEDVFAVLKDAIAALQANDVASVRDTLLPRLDRAIDNILGAAAVYGAQTNRGERTINTLSAQEVSLRVALSSVLDADITEEVATYQLRQTTLQATLLAVSRILPLSLVDFMA